MITAVFCALSVWTPVSRRLWASAANSSGESVGAAGATGADGFAAAADGLAATDVSVAAGLTDLARTVAVGRERPEAALAAPCLGGPAGEPVSPDPERAELACVD